MGEGNCHYLLDSREDSSSGGEHHYIRYFHFSTLSSQTHFLSPQLPTPSTLPNILQHQPLLGCFLVLCSVLAGRSVGRPYSKSGAAVDAIPRGVLLSEAVTSGFSSATTEAFEWMYTYTDNNFQILSPIDYNLSFRLVTDSLCPIPRQ